jgi:hypothetical protein
MFRSPLAFVWLVFASVVLRAENEYEEEPIAYSQTAPRDAAAALQRQLDAGRVTLDRRDAWSLLAGLLKQFKIPPESQVMVFSKTSKQNDHIGPQSPRVVYFGMDAYVGYAQGGSIEVSCIDPKLGPIFYLLDPQVEASQPLRFERDSSCLSCHGGVFTPQVPGVLVRSVVPGPLGHPLMSQGSVVVDSSTEFSKRWGGWYVTGRHGQALHRGNVTAVEKSDQVCELPVEKGANVQDLSPFFDLSAYPRGKSDIVALMVLEHQTGVQNVLTRANHGALRAMHRQHALRRELGEPPSPLPVGSAQRIIEHAARQVLEALLFKDEAPLPEGGIEGEEDFQTAFVQAGRRSGDGRSLRDLQLRSRLFKYRCSYMVHSLTFEHLQPHLKARVCSGLEEILQEGPLAAEFAWLGKAEKAHILRILRDTGVLPKGQQAGAEG